MHFYIQQGTDIDRAIEQPNPYILCTGIHKAVLQIACGVNIMHMQVMIDQFITVVEK